MKKLLKDFIEGTGEVLDAITSNGREKILPEEEKDEPYNEMVDGFDKVLGALSQRILDIQNVCSDSTNAYLEGSTEVHDLVEGLMSVQGQLLQLARDIESCKSKS